MKLNTTILIRKAIANYNEDDNQENLTRITKLLRDSKVWVPCETVLSEADQERFHGFVNDPNGFDAVIGKTFHFNDPLAFCPDEVTDGENNYIPVYSRQEEAGECREGFSLH